MDSFYLFDTYGFWSVTWHFGVKFVRYLLKTANVTYIMAFQ